MNKLKTILFTTALAVTLAGCNPAVSSSTSSSSASVHVHVYDDGVVTTEPTCTEKGTKTFTCECGHSYTEDIAIDPDHHVRTESAHTVATLDTPAYDIVTCAACEESWAVNEDIWTARGVVQVYADVVFEDGSDKVKSAALKDGTPVRYTGANFGTQLGSPEDAIAIVDSEIFANLDDLELVLPITVDGEGGYYAAYKYVSDYTFVVAQISSFVAEDEVSTIVQVMSYLVKAV